MSPLNQLNTATRRLIAGLVTTLVVVIVTFIFEDIVREVGMRYEPGWDYGAGQEVPHMHVFHMDVSAPHINHNMCHFIFGGCRYAFRNFRGD